ncbi:PH domain-containing protein [Candidatus Uhrbacteria bacterium]|nr:PH domain-containing protein [Candidatus Uhrbacteria bacterium]
MIHLNHLPNCSPNEKIIHFLRRHPITLIGLIISYIGILVLPLILYWYLHTYQIWILQDPVWLPIIVLAGSFLFLFVWLFLFQHFMDYYLDIWVVTTERVLNIEQIGLFSRHISELRLYQIQDVTSNVTGAIKTLLDYGNVEIQTAGEKARFLFEEVPHPSRIAKSVIELSEIDRKKHLDEAVEGFT